MTTRIHLLRHGIAVPHGTPDVPDDERPLTPRGEKRLKRIAWALKQLGVAPDKIVTSPLPRALRTAEIVARGLGLEDRLEQAEALGPQSSAGSIREWLDARGEDRLMLVGHNPNLSQLLGLILGLTSDALPFELKKGGVAELRARQGESGANALQWLATPRLLRRTGS